MQRVHRIQDLERHICFAKREQFVCTGFVFLQVPEGMIKEVSLQALAGAGVPTVLVSSPLALDLSYTF